MGNGYVKIHRKIEDWGWYKVTNTKSVFLHLILTAELKDGEFKGHELKRGDVGTMVLRLSSELGLTVSQVRTALKNLIKTGEITQKPTKKFTIITVCNWEYYNDGDDSENPEFNLSQEG